MNEDKDEKPEECSFCSYETEALTESDYGWICNVCFSSVNSALFYSQHKDNDLARQISYCTNMILEAVSNKPEAQK